MQDASFYAVQDIKPLFTFTMILLVKSTLTSFHSALHKV